MIKRIYIEISNVCNLSCAFCMKTDRKPRIMSPEEFEHILSETDQITDYIYLHVQGEPLLHPQFDKMMEIAAKHSCKVQLVTNGLLLPQHPDLISMKALRKVSFSLQSVEYHKKDPAEFMAPIFRFIEEASANGKPYCELRFWRDDQMKLERTEECLNMIHERYQPEESGRVRNEMILPGVYVDYSNPFEWPEENNTGSDTGTCHGAISQIAILSDGTVVPCCLDAGGRIPLGNLFETDLQTILSSERYRNMCEGFRSHRITEELCRSCTYRLRFDR